MNGRWTVSEEERLTTQEALATAEIAASDWTPHNLASFMGTMRIGRQHKLQVITTTTAQQLRRRCCCHGLFTFNVSRKR